MEVHHHPDIHHKKRKFREYFIEFVMIFLAITMGFLAENLREHFTEKNKEVGYAKSMIENLKKDTGNIPDEIRWVKLTCIGRDSLCDNIYKSPEKVNAQELYRLSEIYCRFFGINFSDQTSSELRAGGMSYIKSQEVAAAIARYWRIEKLVDEVADRNKADLKIAYGIGCTIFNLSYIHSIGMDTVIGLERVKIDSSAKLMTNDPKVLVTYANWLFEVDGTLRGIYIKVLKEQYKAAVELMALIKKEYHLKK